MSDQITSNENVGIGYAKFEIILCRDFIVNGAMKVP
jgi:hypothetical protein